jgi:hypothetical protein
MMTSSGATPIIAPFGESTEAIFAGAHTPAVQAPPRQSCPHAPQLLGSLWKSVPGGQVGAEASPPDEAPPSSPAAPWPPDAEPPEDEHAAKAAATASVEKEAKHGFMAAMDEHDPRTFKAARPERAEEGVAPSRVSRRHVSPCCTNPRYPRKSDPMQRGSMQVFLGIGLLVVGIFGLKLTDVNYWWAAVALGAIVGCHGAIQVSERART